MIWNTQASVKTLSVKLCIALPTISK